MDENEEYRVYIVYDKNGQVYALTTDKELFSDFKSTRRLDGYICKKVRMNEYQYRAFVSLFKEKLLMMNVLTDGSVSIDFVTTYGENYELERECDRIMDKIMELEREIVNFPLSDEILQCMDFLFGKRKEKEGRFGKFNSFYIFCNMFKDSIL